jgi:endonuclease-3
VTQGNETPLLTHDQINELFKRLHDADPDRNRVPEKVRQNPFKSLVSVMLSAQSRDSMTARATTKLFAVASTPKAILALPEDELRALIKDAGLYNMKAKNIRAMCADLLERFDGTVPATRKDLMSLPGVGRKSADIIMRFTFHEPFVAVDTHVYRFAKRVGLARGNTEAQLAADLEPRIPAHYRMGAHMWLLNHGKYICTSRKPKCEACALKGLCISYNSAREIGKPERK